MIWDKDISFEGYSKKKAEWFNNPDHFLGDPPISAQYALDLIYKTLVDDKDNAGNDRANQFNHVRSNTKKIQQKIS